MAENRDQYLADVFGLGDPADVRWVFISHDDVDHTGNLDALIEACPNATAVLNWFITERMGASLEVPPTRWGWVADGESFDVGDRRLHAVRPPIVDAPTTRGLYDPATGVYWSSDSVATPMLTPVRNVGELDGESWSEGRATFDHHISPWLGIVDDERYQLTVDRIESLQPHVIAGCHTPVIDGRNVDVAIEWARRSPNRSVAPRPDQRVLHQIQQTLVAV